MSNYRNILICMLLIFSAFLYAGFRIGNTNFHYILTSLNCQLPKSNLVLQDASYLLKVIAFNLPEFLWIQSLMLSISPIDFQSHFVNKSKGFIVIFAFSSLEIFQLFGWTKGTFDVLDIVAVIAAVMINCFLEKRVFNRKNEIRLTTAGLNFASARALVVYLTIFMSHQIF